VDPLYAFNKTTSPLLLPGTSVTLPASATAGARALTAENITAEVQAFTPTQFAALETLRLNNQVDFQWYLLPAFPTPNLSVGRRAFAVDSTTPSNQQFWVDAANGNDSNDGLSSATAFKSLAGFYSVQPAVSTNGPKTIVNFMANGSLQQVYSADISVFSLGGQAYLPAIRFRGPEMVLYVPTTGPATAALDVAPVTELSLNNARGNSVPCRTQLNFVTAAPGWTVDDFAGRAHVRITRGGNRQYFELPVARNTANTLILDTLLYTGSGIVANAIAGAGAGNQRISGLTGMVAGDVGASLVLAGFASSGNNGTFPIAAFVNSTTVDVTNAGGVSGDANNGTGQWFKLPTDRILATDTVEIVQPGAKITGTIDGYNNIGQINVGGQPGANSDAAVQNPMMGHMFERLEFGGPIFSSASLDMGFDRCRFSSSNAIATRSGGVISFSNCAGRAGQLRLGAVTTSSSPAGSRPVNTTSTTTVTDNPLSSGAVTIDVADTTAFPASGTGQVDSEVVSWTGKTPTSLTGVTRGLQGTTAASHVQGSFIFTLTTPVNPLPQVSLTAFATQFNTSAPAPIKTSGGFVYTVHRPLSFWQSSGSGNGLAPLQPVGGASLLVQARGAAILGDCLSGTRQFLRPRLGAQAIIDPVQFFGTGTGGVGDIAVETGAGVSLGVGAGQFMEVNGVNGNLVNLETVKKLSLTQAAADSINITTATGGGPPLKSLKSLNVTAGAAAFLGTYILTDAAGTMISAAANTVTGVARISDDGKTITFPAGTQATAITLAYVPTTPSGDASRVGVVLNNN
jgi:hypothetical protein